jgi:hypothetical protein
MSINGNLQTMNLAELLQWLANGRQTGTLSISNGIEEKKVLFRDGEIVSSSSSDPKGFIGQFLISKGVITEEILAQAIAVQNEQGGLLGEILVEGGAVGQEMLDQMLKLKTEENIFELFAWEEGTFEFRDGDLPQQGLVPMAIHVTGLVMEGIRRLDNAEAIKALIPSPQCVPVSVAPLIDEDEMDPGWLGVLEAVDDDRSVEDICLHTHSSEAFVSQVLYQRITEGKIKVVRPRIVAAESIRSESDASGGTTAPAPGTEALLAEANEHLKNGEFEPATRHLTAAAGLDPHNRELALVVKELESEVMAGIEGEGIVLDAVPVLETALDELRNMSFSPEEGFILSRINGSSDIGSIVKISPLSELDSILVFWKLARDGHIKIES